MMMTYEPCKKSSGTVSTHTLNQGQRDKWMERDLEKSDTGLWKLEIKAIT